MPEHSRRWPAKRRAAAPRSDVPPSNPKVVFTNERDPQLGLPRDAIRPRRALSQSFLTQPSVAEAMVRAAEVSREDTILEIGPGLGALTRPLIEAAGTVVAIEIDAALARSLPARLDFPPNLRVVQADALAVDLDEHLAEPYLVVASLPYHVASPILFKLLTHSPRPQWIVAMVQEEVAHRILGRPGGMTYLGAAVATLAEARLVRRVAPGSFLPVPKVRSAVIRLDLRPQPAVEIDSVPRFLAFLRTGFTQPRKQLHNSLSQGLGVPADRVQALVAGAGIDSRRRSGELALAEWAELYRRLRGSEFPVSDPK